MGLELKRGIIVRDTQCDSREDHEKRCDHLKSLM